MRTRMKRMAFENPTSNHQMPDSQKQQLIKSVVLQIFARPNLCQAMFLAKGKDRASELR